MKNWYNIIPYTFFTVIAITTLYCIVNTVFLQHVVPLQEGFSEGNSIRIAGVVYYLESVPSLISKSDFVVIREIIKEMMDTLTTIDNKGGPVTEETYKKKLMPAIKHGIQRLYGHSSLPLPSGEPPSGLLASLVNDNGKLHAYYTLLSGMTQMYDMMENNMTLTPLNTY